MEKGNYPTDLDSLFRIIDEEIYCSEDSKKPLIGITTYTKEGASCVANLYVNSVIQAGGTVAITRNLHVTGGMDLGFPRYKAHSPTDDSFSMRPSPVTFKLALGLAF